MLARKEIKIQPENSKILIEMLLEQGAEHVRSFLSAVGENSKVTATRQVSHIHASFSVVGNLALKVFKKVHEDPYATFLARTRLSGRDGEIVIQIIFKRGAGRLIHSFLGTVGKPRLPAYSSYTRETSRGYQALQGIEPSKELEIDNQNEPIELKSYKKKEDKKIMN